MLSIQKQPNRVLAPGSIEALQPGFPHKIDGVIGMDEVHLSGELSMDDVYVIILHRLPT